jgi:single-strand DNA-binding protein
VNGIYTTVPGVVGTDPRRVLRSGGDLLVQFRMVSKERKRDAMTGTWADAHTSWMSVTCFRGLAANVEASIRKGDRVLVHGKVRVNEYLSSEGTPRSGVDLTALSVGPDLRFGIARFERDRPDRDRDRDEEPYDEPDEPDEPEDHEEDESPELQDAAEHDGIREVAAEGAADVPGRRGRTKGRLAAAG